MTVSPAHHERHPCNNIYGLARTIIALGTMLTLLGNSATDLFEPAGPMVELPRNWLHITSWNLFWMLKDHLEIARWLGISILAVTASGYRPRVTGLFHWWVTFSFINAGRIPDGGDQVACVLTLVMVPITLADDRTWHWARSSVVGERLTAVLSARVAAWGLFVFRLQVCAIYLMATTGKWTVPQWTNGTGLYYWISDPILGLPSSMLPTAASWLSSPYLVCPLTWSVLVMQLALAFSLTMDPASRRWLLPVGIAFHFGNVVIFGLFSFFFSMLGALVVYLLPLDQELGLSTQALKQRMSLLKLKFGEVLPSPAAHADSASR